MAHTLKSKKQLLTRVRKIKGQDFDPDEANDVLDRVVLPTVPVAVPVTEPSV